MGGETVGITINWEIIILAVIAVVPSTLAALAAYRQASKTHSAVNSRMDELLRVTREQATLVERAAGIARQAEKQ